MSLQDHLKTGTTTICRCWSITRKDGRVFGFTDHDGLLSFDEIMFKADTGLTASALQQVTGLAVDNSEAVGALSDAAITERDIAAGRFDGAEVKSWLVNWRNPEERELRFAGTIGELKRSDGAFHAELRGLSEKLNTPVGKVFQKPCQAILGDTACGVDVSLPKYRIDLAAGEIKDARIFTLIGLDAYAPRWFERGRFEVLDGAAKGLVGAIKNDRDGDDGQRIIELWEEIKEPIQSGDLIRLQVGCDKRLATCRTKFANVINFRGFPHIPGEDWLMAYPQDDGRNRGGSLFK
ncbi:DUF2163 domain-containing protein [Litoreibacter roseus]|uniref:Bacteriophage phiJL001 Gp84 C-terminal domain-containing protein n=1 Tax=Litoreibacter roseus TaxID=2601869 RepID=A0A6N6JK54_9RHOB|nr:DUF2163 domain-containing protein [Litoreibacter roseus]GFE66701.1 hypothetical protein KIN_37750 [Litoreibacter roseus]